jgi:RNA recognition motif-containing protein
MNPAHGNSRVPSHILERSFQMSKKLYITNLSPETTEMELKDIFVQVGNVVSVRVPLHPRTGLQQDYAFIEMETLEFAQAAAQTMNDYILHDRKLHVTEVRNPEDRKSATHADIRPVVVKRPQPRIGSRRS